MSSPQPGDALTAALQQVLAAQHAAVYGYPLIGVTLSQDGQIERARTLLAQHRLNRDALSSQLVSRQASPVAAAASYRPATAVTDPASAQQWALQLEQACAAGYRYLLAVTAASSAAGAVASIVTGRASTGLRQQAITGLDAAAQAATSWRLLLQPDRPTVPFPGL